MGSTLTRLRFAVLAATLSGVAAFAESIATFDHPTIAAFQAGRNVLHFDEWTIQAPWYLALPADHYAACGIRITSGVGGSGQTHVARVPELGHFGPTQSPPNIIGGGVNTASGWRDAVRFDFQQGARAIGAHTDWSGSVTRLSAYDAAGNLIESVDGVQGQFMGIQAEAIAYATWTWISDQGGPGFSLDNVTYELAVDLCAEDINLDGAINLTDLATLLAHFGSTAAQHSDGDLDCDRDVDLTDLARVLARFGSACN